MKPKPSPFVRFSNLGNPFSTFTLSIGIAAAGLMTLASPSALAISQTWDGGPAGTGTVLTDTANWDQNGAVPTAGETATFGDANNTAGDLALTYSAAMGGTTGVFINVLSSHTGTLGIDNATNTTTLRFRDITMGSGAGSVTFGGGDASEMYMTLGGSGNSVNNLTNNSLDTVMRFRSDVRFANGGATPSFLRTINFDGQGNFQFDSGLKPSQSGAQGSFAVVKKGTGTLTLNGTATGNNPNNNATSLVSVAVEQGTILTGATGALGGGGTTVGAGAVALGLANGNSASIINTGAFTQANAITLATGNTGVLTLGGNHITGTSAFTGNIVLNSNVILNAASGGRVDFHTSGTNIISGTGNVTITGGGTIAMAGVNTYSGTTTIENGTLRATGPSSLGSATSAIALGTATTISSNYSTTLRVNGATTLARDVIVGASNASTTGTYTIDTDNGTSAVSLAGNVTLNQNLTVSGATSGGFNLSGGITTGTADARTVTFQGGSGRVEASGAITDGLGTVSVVKNGNNTLVISGNSTYSGATIVNAGTLLVNGTLSNSAITVNGGTVGGTGTIGGALTVNAAFNPGGTAATGSFQAGSDLNLGASSSTNIDLGGTSFSLNGTEEYDRAKLNGSSSTLTLGGALGINFLNGFTLGDDQAFGIFQLESGASLAGTFTDLEEGDVVGNFGGRNLFITYSGNFGDTGAVDITGGNDIVLYTIPEPSAALLGGLGALMLLRRRKQR